MLYKNTALSISLLLFHTIFSHDQPSSPDKHRDTLLAQSHQERFKALQVRLQAAQMQTMGRPTVDMVATANGDLNLPHYPVFRKLFEHDSVTGELTKHGIENFNKFRHAVKTGLQSDFNAVERLPNAIRVFITPQAAYSRTLQGCSSSQFQVKAPPAVTSAAAACDLLEVYGGALCRDVQFSDFGTGLNSDSDGQGGSITHNVARVLHDFGSDYHGPSTIHNTVDASVLFRGLSAGDLTGPFVSQFLLQPLYPLFPAGCAAFVAGAIGVQNLPQDVMAISQQRPIASKREFGVSWDDFIQIQNGYIPKAYVFSDYDQNSTRYPVTPRDLGSFVHQDGPYEAYYNALNIIAYRRMPISPNFPYANGTISNESAGINLGTPDAFYLVGAVSIEAFHASWALKWLCHWRLRPEEMAGFAHYSKISGTNIHNLHPSLFATHDGIDILELTRIRNLLQSTHEYDPLQLLNPSQAGTYLLPGQYPELSPEHPSYVSAHATVAGACVTVIKAIFDDTVLIRDYMTPVTVDTSNPKQLIPLSNHGEDRMTLGGELDKLASNMGMARMFSGVHYRSDGDQGLILGEEVAIRFLQDQARKYTEQGFTGFQLTKRDGSRINITATAVTVIS